MSSYDEQFENQLTVYRRRQRLLVAKSIHFKAARSDFKTVCRDKLSNPNTVKFFWRAADKPWNTHQGWVMLGFELRSDCRRAEKELKDLKFRGRVINIQKASKVAHAPVRSMQSAASTTAPPAATTVIATPIAEGPVAAAAAAAATTTATTTPAITAPIIVPIVKGPATTVAVPVASTAVADGLPKVTSKGFGKDEGETCSDSDFDKISSIDWDTHDDE